MVQCVSDKQPLEEWGRVPPNRRASASSADGSGNRQSAIDKRQLHHCHTVALAHWARPPKTHGILGKSRCSHAFKPVWRAKKVVKTNPFATEASKRRVVIVR
jgi:hypothetical protein